MVAFDLVAIISIACLVALACWQVHRRAWKLELMARIEARVHATPMPAPTFGRWAEISAATDEYRRVTVSGRWLEGQSTLVQAATALGGGYWVLTPLMLDDGTAVLINRGFVSSDYRNASDWKVREEFAAVTGLLRLSEQGGGFLRTNDPAADRWYSRDVAAIAAARGLPMTAPFFIDAERSPSHSGLPMPGLTVITFSNNHLLYALTWLTLALMAAAGTIYLNLDLIRGGRPQATRHSTYGNG